VKSMAADGKPPQVPGRARPGGEDLRRNPGAKPWAWIECMLAAPIWGEMRLRPRRGSWDAHPFATRATMGQSRCGLHRLESRMREIRQSGSEGGGTGSAGSPYPYQQECPRHNRNVRAAGPRTGAEVA